MFIEVFLLCLGLHAGSKLYEKSLKANKTKTSTDKIKDKSVISKKFLSAPLTKSNKLEDSKHPVEKANKPEQSVKLSSATIDKQLAITGVSTVMAGVGKFFPPLIPFGIAGIFYSLKDTVKISYKSFSEERKITFDTLELIIAPGLLFAGYYFTCCFSYFLYTLSIKLLNSIEDNSRQKLVNFFENQPRTVWIIKENIEIEIPFDSLQTGDIVSVKAGETIPADGIITAGVASIDQHILTGESMTLEKGAGEPVFASTVVLSGRILFRVEKSGKETVVANIADILNRTVDYKTGIQSKGEMISDKAILPTIALSAAALPVAGPIGSLAVLSSYIGADVRIMVPLSTLNFLKVASENSILIKDGRALELLSKTDTVVFDKTGTLTIEQLFVRKIYTCDGFDETEILQYAAMSENRQTHPVAKAILEKAEACGITPGNADDSSYEVGYGIRVKIYETVIRVGSARFMKMENIEIPEKITHLMRDTLDRGNSLVMVAKNNLLAGAIELNTTIRPEVKNIVRKLKERHKSLYILTGDNEHSARVMAKELGIDNYFSETFPEQKAHIIEQLQKEGRSVCFVGDGINDSIAMKKAHVSVSLRGASTVATDTANIVLIDGTLENMDKLFEIAEHFDKNTHTTLMLAVVPGVINIAGVFFLHTGIFVAMGLYFITLPLSLLNSFLPIIQHKGTDTNKITLKKSLTVPNAIEQ